MERGACFGLCWGANPRTCRGADGGLPCFPLKEELVEARGGGGDFGPTGKSVTADRRSCTASVSG